MDMLRLADIETWKDVVGAMIYRGDYSPHTANSWLRITTFSDLDRVGRLTLDEGEEVRDSELSKLEVANVWALKKRASTCRDGQATTV